MMLIATHQSFHHMVAAKWRPWSLVEIQKWRCSALPTLRDIHANQRRWWATIQIDGCLMDAWMWSNVCPYLGLATHAWTRKHCSSGEAEASQSGGWPGLFLQNTIVLVRNVVGRNGASRTHSASASTISKCLNQAEATDDIYWMPRRLRLGVFSLWLYTGPGLQALAAECAKIFKLHVCENRARGWCCSSASRSSRTVLSGNIFYRVSTAFVLRHEDHEPVDCTQQLSVWGEADAAVVVSNPRPRWQGAISGWDAGGRGLKIAGYYSNCLRNLLRCCTGRAVLMHAAGVARQRQKVRLVAWWMPYSWVMARWTCLVDRFSDWLVAWLIECLFDHAFDYCNRFFDIFNEGVHRLIAGLFGDMLEWFLNYSLQAAWPACQQLHSTIIYTQLPLGRKSEDQCSWGLLISRMVSSLLMQRRPSLSKYLQYHEELLFRGVSYCSFRLIFSDGWFNHQQVQVLKFLGVFGAHQAHPFSFLGSSFPTS